MGRIEDNICEAIEYIVDNAIANAKYDKTIQATIVKCVDQTIGKYVVKYQDATFYAYSTGTDIKFSDNTSVYVLIPGNDTSQEKTILGTTKKLGIDYIVNAEGEEAYEVIGKNCLTSGEYNLCSYKTENIIIYNKDTLNDTALLDIESVNRYIKGSSSIICGGVFKTSLPIEQQYRGNYGIIFKLNFNDNATGENVVRTCVLDVNQMKGNPYKMTSETRQYGIFEIDGENFVDVQEISLFVQGFPKQAEGKENDILIKKLELSAAEGFTETELASSILTIITPQGTYFNDDPEDKEELNLQAQIRIKGKVVDKDSQEIKYYWFVEDANVDSSHKKYNKYGGQGWSCLNPFNKIDEDLIEWVSEDYQWTVKEEDVTAKETKYKCVVLYGGSTISKEITITNLASAYDITIESSEGTKFYYDIGNPTLTCKINGEELKNSNFSYIWAAEDNNGAFRKLTNEDAMEVNGNKVIGIKISTIINFCIYKCAVYHTVEGKTTLLGTGSIKLINSLKGEGSYHLEILNGSQVFKYNGDGISPASDLVSNPISLKPLSFMIYNNLGQPLSEDILKRCAIEWKIPIENTMLEYDTDTGIVYQQFNLDYDIATRYDINKTNNTIQLNVKYKEMDLRAATNFTFIKEGEMGTNGTEVVCRIVPNVEYADMAPAVPMILNGKLNFTPISSGKWFRAELWRDGVRIFGNSVSGLSSEGNKQVDVQWSILQNKYTEAKSDNSAISVVEGSQDLLYWGYVTDNPANIIKCKVTYNGVDYYATLPLITATANEGYNVYLKENTGFRSVMYTADGLRPTYNTGAPFELVVLENEQDVSKDAFYTWEIEGAQYDDDFDWSYPDKLVIDASYNKNSNPLKCRPEDTYDGRLVNIGLECYIAKGGSNVAKIHIPIHFYLNRYGNESFNKWDGNSISIDEEGGVILAPRIGAGKKDNENAYTGIFMGEVVEAGKSQSEVGLFGYYKGLRSIFLNAEDGSAAFGVASDEGGQILIKPADPLDVSSVPEAVIESNGYSESLVSGNGIQIRFSKVNPGITFGSGNFSVDSNGFLTAKGGGSIAGWNISDNALTKGRVGISSDNSLSTNIAFWAGSTTPESAKFRVNYKGEMNAAAGTIGGWTINSDSLSYRDPDNIFDTVTLSPTDGINIRDVFIVDGDGNVTLNGNITWGTNSSPTQALYAEEAYSKPSGSYDIYPDSNSYGWHKEYNSWVDKFVSYTYDGGRTWTSAIQMTGQDGETPEVDRDAIVTAFRNERVEGDGLRATKIDGQWYLRLNVTYIEAGDIDANRVWMYAYDPDESDDLAPDDRTIVGGFRAAEGHDGVNVTHGPMMFGGDGEDFYIISTNRGTRMQATNSTYFYCIANSIHASESISVDSDRRIKNSINYNLDDYEQFFMNLKPSTFKYNTGSSDRLHTGFIAQDVEEALNVSGVTSQDFAGLTIKQLEVPDPAYPELTETLYSLRYEEFISLNTYMIQKLYKRIEELENKLKEI